MANSFRRDNLSSTIPVLDTTYLQTLKQKDEEIKNRIEERNLAQEKNRKQTIDTVQKMYEALIVNKISEVYQADEALRNIKSVTARYLKKADIEMYEQLKGALENQSQSMEATIFNVKNHAPIVINKENELVRLEYTKNKLQNQLNQEQNLSDTTRANELINQKFTKETQNTISEQKKNQQFSFNPEANDGNKLKDTYYQNTRAPAGKETQKTFENEKKQSEKNDFYNFDDDEDDQFGHKN